MTHLDGVLGAHFPVVHIRPPRGWVNDPNGPIWHRGRFHLFFQYAASVPPSMDQVVWAHSSSADLANWQLEGVALAPSPEHPGVEGFWSGNTVENQGRLYAFYAAYRRSDRYQPPRMTVSDDEGRSFGEDRQMVPPPEEGEGAEIFRDPFVWYQDGQWRLLMGSGRADGTAAQVRLYESDDLIAWTGRGIFAGLEGRPGEALDCGAAWECPQYAWELGVLFVGAWRPATGPMPVLAVKGSEQDGRLVVDGVELADYGPDFYAPSVMRAPDGRYLLWGVVREGRGAQWRDETGWAGMLSLPREVSLQSDRLVTRPARELEVLRGELCREYKGNSPDVVLGEVPAAFELRLRLDKCPATAILALELGAGQVLTVHVDGAAGKVIIDRDRASNDPRAFGGAAAIDGLGDLFAGGAIELRWFVDHSISELFVAGTVAATTRFFPVPAGAWQVRLSTPDAVGVEAELWALQPSVRQATDLLKAAE